MFLSDRRAVRSSGEKSEDQPTLATREGIAESHLLRGLPPDQVANFLCHATQKAWEQGVWICREGEPARHIFLLMKGRVRVYRATSEDREILLGLSAPGTVFGYEAFIECSTYPISAMAAQASAAAVWDSDTIRRLMLEDPRLALNALEMAVDRLHDCENHYGQLATLPTAQRIAETLAQLASRIGAKTNGAILIRDLSAQDLADLSGTTIYTVSRVLSDWHRRGVIQKDRRQIILFDQNALLTSHEHN
jgi:CRP-like cAMP-binding protein